MPNAACSDRKKKVEESSYDFLSAFLTSSSFNSCSSTGGLVGSLCAGGACNEAGGVAATISMEGSGVATVVASFITTSCDGNDFDGDEPGFGGRDG